MHVRGRTAAERVRGGGVGAFFAVRAQHVLVVGLAGDFGDGIGLEGPVRWGAAGREGFGGEGGSVVGGGDFGADLVLLGRRKILVVHGLWKLGGRVDLRLAWGPGRCPLDDLAGW